MTLHVAETGERGAPAVVLLHGAGTSGWMWARQAAALADELHLLILDLPGHGRSNHRPWTSIADTATAVAEVVADRTADGRAHLVGLSLGGYVGLHLAATASWPTGLIASGSSVLPFPNPRRIRMITAAMSPFLRVPALLRANARMLKVPDEDYADFRTAALATNARTVRRVTAEAIAFRLPAGVATSDCPVLAVAGGEEHDLVRRSVPIIAAGFRRGEGRLIDGVGHAWNGERPDVFSAMIKAHVLGDPLPDPLRPLPPPTCQN